MDVWLDSTKYLLQGIDRVAQYHVNVGIIRDVNNMERFMIHQLSKNKKV